MIYEWWEDQMFGYVYYDGGDCQDELWLKELNYIGDEFKKSGWEWCLNGQHWKTGKGSCWSCDF